MKPVYHSHSGTGMSLIELLVAMALSSILTLVLIQMAMAARGSFRLQESLAELQEHGRYFADLVSAEIGASAYHPQPWLHEGTPIGLMPDSLDGSGLNSDKLVSRQWSEKNCYGSLNQDRDMAGQPRFYLKESAFEMSSGNLLMSCRYGLNADEMTTQINRQGAIPQVEVFQALYATDSDEDGLIDAWLRADQWASPQQVRAVRLGILSTSRESISTQQAQNFQVLDYNYAAPADGRLRRVYSITIPISRMWP
jgi:type IV pilus assembly protein PilW